MILHNTEETIEFGKSFAKKLKGGEVLALSGDLGSGKTTFIKGLAEGLKVIDVITSPTFVLLKEYEIQPNNVHPRGVHLVHIDAYRVETIEDIKSVGIEDYLDRDDVILVVEWAEKIKEILPKNVINLNFKYIDENTRKVEIK